MNTVDLIKHFDKMAALADMILTELGRAAILENIKDEKNFLFYRHDEMVKERLRFQHRIDIHNMAAKRLVDYYNKHSKIQENDI